MIIVKGDLQGGVCKGWGKLYLNEFKKISSQILQCQTVLQPKIIKLLLVYLTYQNKIINK